MATTSWKERARPAAALIVLLLAAFALRIYRLDYQSLWWDEGISLHLGTSSLAEIARDRLDNIHPPLYFVVLKVWLALTGVSVFSGRYLSVVASLLQVAAVYAVARRWFGGRLAATASVWLAALLMAISPLSVIYGQETRVYAWLPLVLLGLLAPTALLVDDREGGAAKWRTYLALALVEIIGLHLHYIVVFAVLYVNAWAVLAFWRQRRWPELRRWLAIQGAVALTCLPWYLALLVNLSSFGSEASAGTFLAEAVPLRFLLSQVWVFFLTGLAGILWRQEVRVLAAGAATLLALMLLLRLGKPRTRSNAIRLAAHWSLPLGSALVVWSVRSFSHPRYVSMFGPALILLAAYLVLPMGGGRDRRFVPQLLAAALLVALFGASAAGLYRYFYDPAVAKDNVRAVARYLEDVAGGEDLIVVHDSDWSLPFEYDGGTRVVMPDLASSRRFWQEFEAATAGCCQGSDGGANSVYLMDYRRGGRDWQQVIPFALEKAGRLVDTRSFDGLEVRRYELSEAVARPETAAQELQIGPVKLVSAWLEGRTPAGSAAALALQWRLVQRPEKGLGVALKLVDSEGWTLAQADALLVDEKGRPADQWPLDEEVTTYHLLPIAPGTPPLTFTVGLTVYEAAGNEVVRSLDVLDAAGAPAGQEASLGMLQVLPALEPGANPYGVEAGVAPLATPVELAPHFLLLGASVAGDQSVPGGLLPVTLQWQGLSGDLPALEPRLELRQGGAMLAAESRPPVLGRYPTSRWRPGQVVVEQRRLRVPATAAGRAQVVVSLDDQEFFLGDVDIVASAHQYEQPLATVPAAAQFGDLATLIGFDLEPLENEAGGAYSLTLYWEATGNSGGPSLSVFTHLLSEEGRLVGQHDGPPANGRRPTPGWLAGEYIIDNHHLAVTDEQYRGAATIEVGLYDPVSGERVSMTTGETQFYLPLSLNLGDS